MGFIPFKYLNTNLDLIFINIINLQKKSVFIKIGPEGLRGPGFRVNTSLKVMNLIALFCKISILSSSVLKADHKLQLHIL